jgi:flagellar assembly protein FliH
MILPSNGVGGKSPAQNAPVMPVRLLREEERKVARLEFLPLEQPKVWTESVKENEPAIRLEEEIATLSERLRSQAEQRSAEIEVAREEAKVVARYEWEEEFQRKTAQERTAILKANDEFLKERSRYFVKVEAEVVKLALAIAERVLHREAKLDPLLLTGVVRIALEKMAEDSTTVLRVPVNEVEAWREIFVEVQGASLQLMGDEQLLAGECVLDTHVGRVELGVSAQLEEIERGFFDLMQQRPA